MTNLTIQTIANNLTSNLIENISSIKPDLNATIKLLSTMDKDEHFNESLKLNYLGTSESKRSSWIIIVLIIIAIVLTLMQCYICYLCGVCEVICDTEFTSYRSGNERKTVKKHRTDRK